MYELIVLLQSQRFKNMRKVLSTDKFMFWVRVSCSEHLNHNFFWFHRRKGASDRDHELFLGRNEL